jgi:hypothetical protein
MFGRELRWIDPEFGRMAGREVHDAWKLMIRNKMRATGYRVMTIDERLDFDSEVAGMKARAYLDATQAMMEGAGIAYEKLRDLRTIRDHFEARVMPGGPGSDAIGTIYTARECETKLLVEIRELNLDPDLRTASVDDPFVAPTRYRSIQEDTLDFA